MSIYAAIYNADLEPLTDGIKVSDDSDFEDIEAQAVAYATAGTECCISWSRDSDGLQAYWGPTGATFEPHWYI